MRVEVNSVLVTFMAEEEGKTIPPADPGFVGSSANLGLAIT